LKMTAVSTQLGSDEPGGDAAARMRALKQRAWYLAALQMAALLLMTVLFEWFDVDRWVAARFYRAGQGWYLAQKGLWRWLYAYGTIPGLLVALAALVVFLAGLRLQALKPWRKPCLLVVLTTVIAAGLLVNAVLKQYWGRPRPDQTVEFGGHWQYRPIYLPATPGKGASFPCGHCTMGFVLLSMIGFHRRSKALAMGGVGAGVVLGVLLSAARIVQGAHFLSDTIWSAGIVGITATLLYAYLAPFQGEDVRPDTGAARRPRLITTSLAIAAAVFLMAAAFMTRRPFYSTMVYPLRLEPSIEQVVIHINADPERVTVQYGHRPDGRLEVDAHGFGWLKFDYHMGCETRITGRLLNIHLDAKARSYFAELDHALTLTLPEGGAHQIAVKVNDRWIPATPGG
jgi:lipid A 4'-phosphatase